MTSNQKNERKVVDGEAYNNIKYVNYVNRLRL